MEALIESIRYAIKSKNWLAAIFMTLSVPDICSSLEGLPQGQTRYANWFDRYLKNKYLPMFTSDDCYYFRCKCLHEGLTAHELASNRGIIFLPPLGGLIHLNKSNGILQMQVDVFCEDICEATEQWLRDVQSNHTIQENMKSLIAIKYPDVNGMISF